MADIESLFQAKNHISNHIIGRTTINLAGGKLNIDVLFETHGRRFMIMVPVVSGLAFEAKEFLFGRIINMVFVNETGQNYSAYGCACVKSTMTINYITIEGEYVTLLRGHTIPTEGLLEIHFEGLEHFSEDFTLLVDENMDEYNRWELVENDGNRVIAVRLTDIYDFEILHNLLVHVREYFEFIVNHELIFDVIHFKNAQGEGIEIIQSDMISSEKSFIFRDKTLLTKEVIFHDLYQWLMRYDEYKEPIYIWKKSIYNSHISEEDVFLWRCQAFELLCELNKTLYDAAMQLLDGKQKEPNLRNYLEALNSKHHFIDCEKQDLIDVKEVRNLYTHNNPKKMVSKRQWHNSIHIIQLALIEGIKYVFGMENRECKGFYLHIANGSMEEVRKRLE